MSKVKWTEISIGSIAVSAAGSVLSVLHLLAVFIFDRAFFAAKNELFGQIEVALIFLGGLVIILVEIVSDIILKRKSALDAVEIGIALILGAVIYGLFMLLFFEDMIGLAPLSAYLPAREMAGGFMVFLMQVFSCSAALGCVVVHLIKIFEYKKCRI